MRSVYLVVLAGAAILYIATCAPGALWQDSGMFQYRIWHNDIEGGLGLALAHPLYHMIGIVTKCVPIAEFGYRVNLISALCAAVAVANVFLLLRLWLNKTLPAVVGAVTLAVSWTFWQHACIAEVYTLYAALFTAELICLLQYLKNRRVGYLYLLGLFNGLSIANHMWGVIALACYAVLILSLLIRKEIRISNIAIMLLLWIIGAGPYEYLVIGNIIRTGDVAGTLISTFFGNGYGDSVLNTSISLQIVLENLLFVGLNFPTPNILLLFIGVFGLYKVLPDRKFGHVMLALLIVFFVFAFRYLVPDRYAFFIPFYCLASVLIGVGAYFFLKKYPQRVYAFLLLFFMFLPLPVYGFVSEVAQRLKINLGTKRTIPYRNDYTYFLQPWQQGNDGPELFATESLNSVAGDGVIIADGTTVYPLWYAQVVKGMNTHVKVVSRHGDYQNPIEFPVADTIGQLMTERAVYVVSPVRGYCPDYLLERYDFIKQGPLYRVVERQ